MVRRIVVGGVLTLLVLAGCSLIQPYPEIPRNARDGGQTQAELDAKLTEIPGLIINHARGSEPNVKGNTGYSYNLTLDPDYRITDPEGLVHFLVESAWSVRDGYQPNTDVTISLLGVPGDNLNLGVVGEETGWVPVSGRSIRDVAENGYTSLTVSVNIRQSRYAQSGGGPVNRERLGSWPGDAPDVPVGVTEPRT